MYDCLIFNSSSVLIELCRRKRHGVVYYFLIFCLLRGLFSKKGLPLPLPLLYYVFIVFSLANFKCVPTFNFKFEMKKKKSDNLVLFYTVIAIK